MANIKRNLTMIRCPELEVSTLTSCHREPHVMKALLRHPTYFYTH